MLCFRDDIASLNEFFKFNEFKNSNSTTSKIQNKEKGNIPGRIHSQSEILYLPLILNVFFADNRRRLTSAAVTTWPLTGHFLL